jgi:hypothetical protein
MSSLVRFENKNIFCYFQKRSTLLQCQRCSSDGIPDGIGIFKPEIPIWINFGRSCNGRCWYFMAIFSILRSNGIFHGHLVQFVVIGILFRLWHVVLRKIWQPCVEVEN